MAESENRSGAQHLTSLDLDISGIYKSLETAKIEIEKYSIESGKAWLDGINKTAAASTSAKFDASQIIDKNEIKKAKEKLDEFALSFGKFAKATMQTKGDGIFGSITFDDDFGKKYIAQVEYVENSWKKTNVKLIDDAQKRENEIRKEIKKTTEVRKKEDDDAWAEYESQQTEKIRILEEERKAWEAFNKSKEKENSDISKSTEKEVSEYEKQLAQEAKLISEQNENSYKEYEQIQNQKLQKIEQERLAWEQYAKERKSQEEEIARQSKKEADEYFAEEVKKDEYKKDSVSKLETMIEKQTQFNSLVKRQKFSFGKTGVLKESDALIQRMSALIEKFKMSGEVTEDMENEMRNLQSEMKRLGVTFEETGSNGDSFLRKIIDKAKWLSAFYVVNTLRRGLRETVSTLKETEDAVVNLQRVLNEDVGQSKMSKELYEIAYNYGRTFADVSEVSTAFAQAGYDLQDTFKLTEGTMLALNTAELDVTQSTKGLIAIMQQWNFEAEDYATVVDKINITADNFAVTSESIVAALQRSSSSAKNANVSFEQTIGLITALAEATGRSGENIGTALNSLLIYTSSDKSLKAFAENGSKAMKDLVKSYKTGAASIYDVWKQLSKEVKHLSASQQAILFDSDQYREFANSIAEQSSEFTDQVNKIYGQAGKYRQNYFIALLDDIATAEDVIENMSGAEGYSMKENQRYMETLTAQWNQLKDIFAELAVQLGEAGFMGMLKGFIQFGIELAKITKDMGGILKIATALGGVVLAIKRQKVENFITSTATSIRNAKLQLHSFKMELSAANGTAAKAKVLFNSVAGSASALATSIGLATVAFTAISSAINYFKARAREAREEAISTSNEVTAQSQKITNLVASYNALAKSSGNTAEKEVALKDVSEKVTEALGARADALKGLSAGTAEYTKKLNELTKSELESRQVELEDTVKQTGKAMIEDSKDLFGAGFKSYNIPWINLAKSANEEITDVVDNILGKYKQWDSISKEYFYGPMSGNADDVAEYVQSLKVAEKAITNLGDGTRESAQALADDSAYKSITKVIDQMTDSFNAYVEAQVNAIANQYMYKEQIPSTIEELDNMKEAVFDASGANEQLRDVIYDLVEKMFPGLTRSASETGISVANAFEISADAIKELEENIKSVNESIDGFQSSYDALISAMDEYNSTGYLSVDTVQKLLSLGSEYVSMLNFTADGVTLNTSKAKDLFAAQSENIDALIQQTTYSGLLEIAQRYLGETTEDLGNKSSNAAPDVDTLEGSLQELANTATNATFNVAMAGEAIDRAFGGKMTKNNLRDMKKEMTDYLSSMNNLSNSISGIAENEKAWVKSQKDTSKQQNDAAKKQLEEQKRRIKERYDAEIKALKNLKAEKDRDRKEDEYYRQRQDALKNVAKAESRSGIEFREQEEDARNKLDELDRKHREMLEDWSIDDRVKELEKLRDSEIAALDAQIRNLGKTVSDVGSSTVPVMSRANETNIENYQKEYLEPFAEQTKETYETVYSELPAVFADTLDEMLEMSKLNSMQMYNIYNENFFSKIKQSMIGLQAAATPFTIEQPKLPQYLPYSDIRGYGNQNITTNNTRNANVFANVYNQPSANAILSGFFSKP